MRKRIAVVAITGFVLSSVVVFATTSISIENNSEQMTNLLLIESHMEKIKQSFSGIVMKTEAGVALETVSGLYQLEGISLEETVGKEVNVTGILKSDGDRKVIYVVKAEIKG